MNKLTIALCDDDETAVTIIGGTLKSLLDKKNVEAEIFAYLSVHELRKSMESRAYDLVLLDISIVKLHIVDTFPLHLLQWARCRN